jgi:hypothetical protein
MQWLFDDNWKIKFSKCKFAQTSIAYLGHVISGQGVSTDSSKIQTILDWPIPKTIIDVRGFLGIVDYYRKFVRHFGIVARPLHDLLRKDVPFQWIVGHDQAFQSLKHALTTSSCLALPNFTQPFHIETNACAVGVGVVLLQNGHPLAYISKAWGLRNQGLSTYGRSIWPSFITVDQWRHYLLQGEFYIHTDQKSLVHLNEQRLHTQWQQKVFTKPFGTPIQDHL